MELYDGYEFMINSPYYDEIEELKSFFQEAKLYIPIVHCEKAILSYSHLYESAQKYGLDLLVENVVCNVENPMKHLCELREKYSNVHFVFDTKMAAFHEQLNLLYETEYEWLWKDRHICHYHVNDYAGGYMDWENLRSLPIGKGKLDFTRFFEFIKKIGYDDTFTVEATAHNGKGIVDVEMANSYLSARGDFR